MGKSKKHASKDIPNHMVCDEGGTHEFKFPRVIGCCDRCLCVFCFPCYAICSCAFSEGAAFANPVFEQMCCSKGKESSEEPGTATCRKCGLSEMEARDLSDVRDMEARQGNRNTGYFSNAMSMPSASQTNTASASRPPQENDPASPTRSEHTSENAV